jgi:hypothetical protein
MLNLTLLIALVLINVYDPTRTMIFFAVRCFYRRPSTQFLKFFLHLVTLSPIDLNVGLIL